jgi:hypothetical protein
MEQHLHLWQIEYEKPEEGGDTVHLLLPYTTGPDNDGTTHAWMSPNEARHFANDILKALDKRTSVVGTGLGSSETRLHRRSEHRITGV